MHNRQGQPEFEFIPSEYDLPQLYFSGNRIKNRYTAIPVSLPIVDRIIAQHQDVFSMEGEIKSPQRKTIVLGCDWTAANWLEDQRKLVLQILQGLLKEGFNILAVIGEDHDIKSLSSPEEIASFIEEEIKNYRPTDSADITKKITKEKNISADNLLILDYFELRNLLADIGSLENDTKGHVLLLDILASPYPIEIFKQLLYRKQETYINISSDEEVKILLSLIKEVSAVTDININDSKIRLKVRSFTPITYELFKLMDHLISELEFYSSEVDDFVRQSEPNNKLHFLSLKSFVLGSSYLYSNSNFNILALAIALSMMPNIETFNIDLVGSELCADNTDKLHENLKNVNLKNLKNFRIVCSGFHPDLLQRILSTAINLEELKLNCGDPKRSDDCDSRSEQSHFKVFTQSWLDQNPTALQAVKKFTLTLSDIEPEQLQQLLSKMKTLETLDLSLTKATSKALTLEWAKEHAALFKNIRILNLAYTDIDPEALQFILSRSPLLKELNITGYKKISDALTPDWLIENSDVFCNLIRLNLSETDITTESLLSIMSRAMNLEILTLDKCDAIREVKCENWVNENPQALRRITLIYIYDCGGSLTKALSPIFSKIYSPLLYIFGNESNDTYVKSWGKAENKLVEKNAVIKKSKVDPTLLNFRVSSYSTPRYRIYSSTQKQPIKTETPLKTNPVGEKSQKYPWQLNQDFIQNISSAMRDEDFSSFVKNYAATHNLDDVLSGVKDYAPSLKEDAMHPNKQKIEMPRRNNDKFNVDAHTKNEKIKFHLNQLFFSLNPEQASPHPSTYRLSVYNHLHLPTQYVTKINAFDINNKNEQGNELDPQFQVVDPTRSMQDVMLEKPKDGEKLENLYYAKTSIILDKDWQALPSLSSHEEIKRYHLDPAVDCEFAYSKRDNLYYIRSKDNHSHVTTIDFLLEVSHPPLPKALEEVEKLVRFYQAFSEGTLNFQGPGTGKAYIAAINTEKKGACRHRAVAFMDAFEKLKPSLAEKGYTDAQCRYVINDCHAFVEVRMSMDQPWVMYNLGGYTAELTIDNQNKPTDLKNNKIEHPTFATNLADRDDLLLPELFLENESPENNKMSEVTAQQTDDINKLQVNEPVSETGTKKSAYNLEERSLFVTWKNADLSGFSDEKSYLFHLIAAREKNCLVDFEDPDSIFPFLTLLLKHCQDTHHSVHYINSPDDLICMSPYLLLDENNKGKITPGPGGSLYDFLTQKTDTKKVLVVNWSNFSAEDIVKFNSIIDDEERKVDGVIIPSEVKIIGLHSSKDSSIGSDFSRRFDIKTKCPFPAEELQASSQLLSNFIIKKDKSDNQIIDEPIELYQSSNWKSYLLGKWKFSGQSMQFEKGPLLKAMESGKNSVVISNGLWSDPDFQLFWQQLINQKYIMLYGKRFELPEKFQVITTEGYDWENLAFSHKWKRAAQGAITKDSYAINSSTLNYLFERYICDMQDQSLKTNDGFFAAYENKKMALHITNEMTIDQWGMLLSQAQKYNVTLEITILPNIVIPSAFNTDVNEELASDESDILERNNTIYLSKDRDATISYLCETYQDQESIVLDVSEYTAEDLFVTCIPHLKNNGDQYQILFNLRISDVWSALEEGKTVILTGHFSIELANQLSSLLGNDGYYILNGEKKKYSGKLIIVSEDPGPFKGFSMAPDPIKNKNEISYVRQVTLDKLEKAKELFHEITTSDPWNGLINLSSDEETKVNIENVLGDEEFCKAFDESRLNQVKDVWKFSPYAFLAGKTGVGKSTFVKQVLDDKTNYRVYYEEKKLLAWVNDKSDSGKVLFIDEANLTSCNWSQFEGLFTQPPRLLINGKFYELTDKHKVLFAGNPLSYGGERHLPTLFERHGGATTFTPLPSRYVAHRILKNLVTTLSENHQQEVISFCLKLYDYIVSLPYQEILITPRELEMITLFAVMHWHPAISTAEIQFLMCSSIDLVMGNIIPEKDKIDFNRWLEEKSGVKLSDLSNLFPRNRPDDRLPDDFVITNSIKQSPYQALRELLYLREFRQNQSESLALSKGGLGGVMIEGEPGVGKSQFAKKLLISHGLKELNISKKVSLYARKHKPTTEELTHFPKGNAYFITEEGLFYISKKQPLLKVEIQENEFNQLLALFKVNVELSCETQCVEEKLSNSQLKDITRISGHIHYKNQGFYHIPVGMRPDLKEALLEKAFHEGAVILIDEINASPMMEKTLNALLMGYDSNNFTARHPGYLLIGTQNPISMAGRKAASEAIQRRTIKTYFPNYTAEDLLHIITNKYRLTDEAAIHILGDYLNALQFAIKNHKEPIPTPGDLFRVCRSIEKGKKIIHPLQFLPEQPSQKVVSPDSTMEVKDRGKGKEKEKNVATDVVKKPLTDSDGHPQTLPSNDSVYDGASPTLFVVNNQKPLNKDLTESAEIFLSVIPQDSFFEKRTESLKEDSRDPQGGEDHNDPPINDDPKALLSKLNTDFLLEKSKINLPNFIQKIVGMDNTFTWQDSIKKLRDQAWKELIKILRKEKSDHQKIEIIKYAISLQLFNAHRSNYSLTQNTKNTRAVNMLNEIIKELNGKRPEDLTKKLNIANSKKP